MDTKRVKETARHTIAQLKMFEQTFGETAAMEAAEGMGCGIRDYLLTKFGRRVTYNLVAGFADEEILNAELPVGK